MMQNQIENFLNMVEITANIGIIFHGSMNRIYYLDQTNY